MSDFTAMSSHAPSPSSQNIKRWLQVNPSVLNGQSLWLQCAQSLGIPVPFTARKGAEWHVSWVATGVGGAAALGSVGT